MHVKGGIRDNVKGASGCSIVMTSVSRDIYVLISNLILNYEIVLTSLQLPSSGSVVNDVNEIGASGRHGSRHQILIINPPPYRKTYLDNAWTMDI